MAKTVNLHVVRAKDGWAVKKEASTSRPSVYDTQRDAVEAGRKIARDQGILLVVHGRDGRILQRKDYGSDPLPPKETRKVLYPKLVDKNRKKSIEKAIEKAVSFTIDGSKEYI